MLLFDFGSSEGANNIQVFEKYMLVKRNDNVIVNIPKTTDEPNNAWGFTQNPKKKEFMLIIHFDSGKTIAYKVEPEKQKALVSWEIKIGEFKEMKGGKQMEAKEVNLEEEEQILEGQDNIQEPGEEEDLGENDKSPGN